MSGKWRAGQPGRALIAVGVVGMAVGVDDVEDGEPLFARTLDERVRRIGGIDQDGLPRGPVAEEVAEVAVAAGPYLFEHQRQVHNAWMRNAIVICVLLLAGMP